MYRNWSFEVLNEPYFAASAQKLPLKIFTLLIKQKLEVWGYNQIVETTDHMICSDHEVSITSYISHTCRELQLLRLVQYDLISAMYQPQLI